MFILDRMLIGGLGFVLDQVRNVAEAELADTPGNLRERLLNAQMQLELGEISDEEFAEIEADIFARLRALRGDEGSPRAISFGGADAVEVDVDAGEESGPDD